MHLKITYLNTDVSINRLALKYNLRTFSLAKGKPGDNLFSTRRDRAFLDKTMLRFLCCRCWFAPLTNKAQAHITITTLLPCRGERWRQTHEATETANIVASEMFYMLKIHETNQKQLAI